MNVLRTVGLETPLIADWVGHSRLVVVQCRRYSKQMDSSKGWPFELC